jgi:hypothetical protein
MKQITKDRIAALFEDLNEPMRAIETVFYRMEQKHCPTHKFPEVWKICGRAEHQCFFFAEEL